MLIVRRRIGERIVIGGGIEITVTEAQKGSVRLGVIAPRGVLVLRGEVHDAIAAANAAAFENKPDAEEPTSEEHAPQEER
jgi:carbon storage regulator